MDLTWTELQTTGIEVEETEIPEEEFEHLFGEKQAEPPVNH